MTRWPMPTDSSLAPVPTIQQNDAMPAQVCVQTFDRLLLHLSRRTSEDDGAFRDPRRYVRPTAHVLTARVRRLFRPAPARR